MLLNDVPLMDPRSPQLSMDCLTHILRHSDEPTRDSAMRVSRDMKAATDMARRLDYAEAAKRPGRWTREGLPTAIELAVRGCPKPHWRHIAQTMQIPIDKNGGPLTRFYALRIGLMDAQKAGYAAVRVFHHSFVYVGGEVNGRKEGFGVSMKPDSDHYEGDWKDDRPHGHGIHIYANGDRYEGSWFHGCHHGHGVRTWANGDRYEGGWFHGCHQGYGVRIWANGDRYEGDWTYGWQDGHGVRLWANGDRDEGNWKPGRFDANGTWINFRGNRSPGLFEGHGVRTCANGDRYEGGWKAGLHNGYGVQTCANGDRYEGYWKAGLRDGPGVQTCANGDRYEGYWRAGERITEAAPDSATAPKSTTFAARCFGNFAAKLKGRWYA